MNILTYFFYRKIIFIDRRSVFVFGYEYFDRVGETERKRGIRKTIRRVFAQIGANEKGNAQLRVAFVVERTKSGSSKGGRGRTDDKHYRIDTIGSGSNVRD